MTEHAAGKTDVQRKQVTQHGTRGVEQRTENDAVFETVLVEKEGGGKEEDEEDDHVYVGQQVDQKWVGELKVDFNVILDTGKGYPQRLVAAGEETKGGEECEVGGVVDNKNGVVVVVVVVVFSVGGGAGVVHCIYCVFSCYDVGVHSSPKGQPGQVRENKN